MAHQVGHKMAHSLRLRGTCLQPLSLSSVIPYSAQAPAAIQRGMGKRCVAIPSDMAARGTRSNATDLWALIDYNAHYFNAHRMTPILMQLLEEPREEVRADARLMAYLKRAQASVQLYENIKDLTAKDLAAAVVAAREIGHAEAEELSDILVDMIAAQIPKLSAQRVSFFVTAFAKHQIKDRSFWRAAAAMVANSGEPFSPQVLVSLFDAFRKSGVRSQKFFLSLSRRLYHVIEDLTASNIPPIIATLCRVPMPADERERAVRALLGRWLSMLRQERQKPTSAIAVQQILNLTVSLGLAPEEINVAVFARDVSIFIGERFDTINVEDLIVFLWALQRLVPSGSLTTFFANGLRQVSEIWGDLRAGAQLSVQRLTQVSDVLVAARQDGTWDDSLSRLQDNIIQDLGESVQYCTPEGLAELLEIWAGNEAFWRHYRDFSEAVVKRLEELLLESVNLEEVIPVLQAAVSVPGLCSSLPGRARDVLASAIQGRGCQETERIRAIFAGSRWETICGDATLGEEQEVDVKSVPESGLRQPLVGEAFTELVATWSSPNTRLPLVEFLRPAADVASNAEEALQALETAAPFAQRLGGDVTGEIGALLERLADQITSGLDTLPPPRVVAALRACAVAGLPHIPLFVSVLPLLESLGASRLVEVLEAYAALRLFVPELQPWFDHLMSKGVDRRLPAASLARLLAAAARLTLLDAITFEALMRRLLTVASPMRPPSLETVVTLCNGLYLIEWTPQTADLWQVVAWLAHFAETPKTPPQAVALRQFAFKVLANEDARRGVEQFQSELKEALAAALREPPVRRHMATDTSLKFRHEAAEVLRSASCQYDLDISLGFGFCVDLALQQPSGALWLLDGPEAFHRPFSKVDLRLVPAEMRRMQLLQSLRDDAEEIHDAFAHWDRLSGVGVAGPVLMGSEGAYTLFGKQGPWPLKRLSWLEWSDLPPHARMSALSPLRAGIKPASARPESTSRLGRTSFWSQ